MTIKANFPAIKPSLNLDFANSKVLDPRITFSRASTATYYDGKTTVKAEENLLTYSQDFSLSPGGYQQAGTATITANADTAPDGTMTAGTVNSTGAGGVRRYVSFIAGTQYAISVYVKSVSGDTSFTADLQNSDTSPTLTLTTAWQRFSYVVTPSVTRTWIDLQIAGSGVFAIWGFQVEQRSQVTSYIATTSAPITNYIPALQTAAANVARFDHDPVTGESKGLLIEEQRTNLLTYSDQFDNAVWTKADATISANSVIAPDGTATADKLVESSTTAIHYARQAFTFSATAYAFSIYLKAAGRNWAHILAGSLSCYFDLSGGVVGTAAGGTTGTINSVGNGWYRCTITGTATAVADFVYVRTASANNTNNYAGDGYSGIYIWGAQLEAGSFPTSYIPTTTAQVTRSADSASMTGTNFSSWYRADEGTVFSEYLPTFASAGMPVAFDNSGTRSLIIYDGVSSLIQFFYKSSSASPQLGTATAGSNVKVAVGVDVTSASGVMNGGAVQSVTQTMQVPNRLSIGSEYTVNAVLNSTIKRIAYYPKRLSNTELQSLTS